MAEPLTYFGAVAAGAFCGVSFASVAQRQKNTDAVTWLERRRRGAAESSSEKALRWSMSLDVSSAREWLRRMIDRAGWRDSVDQLAAKALTICACMTVLGAASASLVPAGNPVALGVIGLVSGIGLLALLLRSAVNRRRRRLGAELVPLLELFTLELSGGGSALSALGTVTTRVQGELAADLRRLLIGAQVAGSSPFEARLMQYSEHLDISALGSLATILGASREYGTGVLHGVRALATDLRHTQRRELIAQSRRALNHVLIPAAVGVLLPFLAVVMFPAVTALQRNLH